MIPVVVDPSFSLSVGSSFFFGRFDSMVPLASRRAGYFSLLAQREVTKRKSAPASAPIGLRPTGTLRCSPPSGRRTTRPSLASDSSPFPAGRLCSSALLQGTRSKHEPERSRRRLGRAGCALARGPYGAAGRRRKGPQGGRQDAGQFAVGTRMCRQRTPKPARAVERLHRSTDPSGPRFFWLLFFGGTKKSDSRAEGARKLLKASGSDTQTEK